MADVATIGIIQQRSLRHPNALIDQPQTPLDSRVFIEQDKGVLAERHHIDPGHAFTLLRNYARNDGHRLTDLAAAIIDGSTTERFTTANTSSSTVVNRRPHSGHDRRQRIAWPSSTSCKSTTRESECR